MERIAVVGIGAIGGLVARGLHRAGFGPNLLASARGVGRLRERGLRVRDGDVVDVSRPSTTDDAHALGVQDLVFVCLKEPALRASAAGLAALVGPDTIVVTMQNGVPWWFAGGLAALQGRALTSIDPDGVVERSLPSARCIGCVVYLASSIDADGVVVAGPAGRLVVGDPGARDSERVRRVASILEACGFAVEVDDDIRRATWIKLLGNVTMNPLGALTGATVGQLLDDAATLRATRTMMGEAIAIASALGIDVGITIDQRIDAFARLRDTKTSMLQDLEAGRVLEIDAIVAAVAELGVLARVPTPAIEAVLGMIRLRAKSARRESVPGTDA